MFIKLRWIIFFCSANIGIYSLYAATKCSNELIAYSYSNSFNLKTTGMRYFTVYGPWYRPDMAMFIFVKAELFLPIVGGVFVFSVLSSIIQRTFFRYILWRKGRKKAEKYRFFLRSPYHHHLQRLWTYSEKEQDVVSVWVVFLNKLGINPVPEENKLLTPQEVNSRVIWHMHIKSIWLFVLTMIIYFKVR